MPPKAKNSRETIKVAVRLRPMSSKEKASGFKSVVEIDQQNSSVSLLNEQGQPVSFTFDYAFPDNIAQEDVYEQTAAGIVNGVLEGYNGTIFAYGQTGTGKTYTMDGEKQGPHRGIVPRAFEHIFDYIAANQETKQFAVTVTYVELYNDEVRDLLSKTPDQKLKVREHPTKGVYVQGALSVTVQTLQQLEKYIKMGRKNRKVRATEMNPESSRSHSVLILNVASFTTVDGTEQARSAKLNLVDLAGSERQSKTGLEGEGFREGVNINYALMVLGNCISALTSNSHGHIPFRDSKLTMLLKDSLGGNARTLMIAALGPADYNFSESMSTLRYAERVKKIENKPKVNMDPKDALVQQLKEELEELQRQLGGAPIQTPQQPDISGLENAAHKAATEREAAKVELQQRIEKTKQIQSAQTQLQERVDELNRLTAEGTGTLIVKTKANEQELQSIRQRLAEREERLQRMKEKARLKEIERQKTISTHKTLEEEHQHLTQELKETVSNYQNLKVKQCELDKTIIEDRVQLSEGMQKIQRQIDFYRLLIDNFIPEQEVERLMANATFDEQTNTWGLKEQNKRDLMIKLIGMKHQKTVQTAPQKTERRPPPVPHLCSGLYNVSQGDIDSVVSGFISGIDEFISFDIERPPESSRSCIPKKGNLKFL